MDGVARTLTYGHDIRGFRTSLTHPDTTVFTYAPDTIGRMTTLSQGATTLRGYSYDGNGRLTGSALGSGTPGSTTLGYDSIGRLNVLTHNIFGTGADVTFGFTYSAASQTLTQSRDNDSYAWTGAVAATRNYTTNGLNQYTQVVSSGTTPFTYDPNGNLTSSSDASGAWTYLYDVENRLVQATFTPTGGTATVTNQRYDPMGRLYQVAGAATTRFLYDGDELVAEYDAAGAMLKRYVHGIAVDDPVIDYAGSSLTSPRHLLADRQGSLIGLTDASGAIIAKNTYDEYGIPKSDQAGQAVVGRFAYTGQIWLPELGMYHYKARLYSPTLGRFLQTDPIGYDDQINLYAYVGNDPVNKMDSTGEKVEWVFKGPADRRTQTKTEKYLSRSAPWGRDYSTLKRSEKMFTIVVDETKRSGFSGRESGGGEIIYNPKEGILLKSGEVQSPAMGLAHEVAQHAAPFAKGDLAKAATEGVERETVIAKDLGEPIRDKYTDTKGTIRVPEVDTKGPLKGDPEPYHSPDDTDPR